MRTAFSRGNVFHEKKQLDRAIVDYEISIKLDLRQAHPYNGLGNVYIDKHDPVRAYPQGRVKISLPESLEILLRGEAEMAGTENG